MCPLLTVVYFVILLLKFRYVNVLCIVNIIMLLDVIHLLLCLLVEESIHGLRLVSWRLRGS